MIILSKFTSASVILKYENVDNATEIVRSDSAMIEFKAKYMDSVDGDQVPSRKQDLLLWCRNEDGTWDIKVMA